MSPFELKEWEYELHDAYWANLLGDYDYADKKLLEITKRYVYGKYTEIEPPQQPARNKKRKSLKRAGSFFRRRNSDTD